MSSCELIKMLEEDGWILVAVRGSHHHYKHPIKKGKVTDSSTSQKGFAT